MSASSPSSSVSPTPEAAASDASVRLPVLVFLGFAVLWLLIASALGLAAAIKLHTPSFLANCEFLTFGRVYPAANDHIGLVCFCLVLTIFHCLHSYTGYFFLA